MVLSFASINYHQSFYPRCDLTMIKHDDILYFRSCHDTVGSTEYKFVNRLSCWNKIGNKYLNNLYISPPKYIPPIL